MHSGTGGGTRSVAGGGASVGARGERSADRRTAIIDAAEALFVEQGFERTSLAAVVARSGGSLTTVYALFGNKQGLLRAVVDRTGEGKVIDIEGLALDTADPVASLKEIAHRLHDFCTLPKSIALMRVVAGESMRDAAFAQNFHLEVRQRHATTLGDIFARWNAAGFSRIDDVENAAELFFATVLGDAQLGAIFGMATPACTVAEVYQRIDWRLAPFIAHFAIGASGATTTP